MAPPLDRPPTGLLSAGDLSVLIHQEPLLAQRLQDDDRIALALSVLDTAGLAKALTVFETKAAEYCAFHRRERRLWALHIGKGNQFREMDDRFIKSIPAGKRLFQDAFKAIDTSCQLLEDAGFSVILKAHGNSVTKLLSNPNSPLTQSFTNYFLRLGCSQDMVDDFRHQFGKVDFQFFGTVAKDLDELREVAANAVRAQVSILEYTEKHGFTFLKGNGPPAWAIAVSKILASVGISIAAWVIVLIVLAVIAILAIICFAACKISRGGEVCKLCTKVAKDLHIPVAEN
jgi:hypothetical protein